MKTGFYPLALALLLAVPLSAPLAASLEAGAAETGDTLDAQAYSVAVLQGLDRTTARVSAIEVPIGQPVAFGGIEITAQACYKTPPEAEPEVAAFLQIDDIGSDRPRERVFSGWMYASSPAVSALEHPVYDVWVVDCAGEAIGGDAAAK